MPRIARQTLLERFRAKIAAGRPLIGGGAGTGLSAKCEEAGGIDLIVIYNSGRYRMAGRGSLAGLLAYGNANEIVCEMAHEVLPVVKHTPVLAGVNGTDPFMIADEFLQRLIALGFSGVQNFPTVGLIDGTFRANLEETGMGYGLEVELIARAHALDLLTTPYVFNEAEATAMTEAGADIVVCHLGLTTGGAIGARDGADARRLRAADRGARRGGAGGAQRRDRPLPRRPDRDARRRRLHPRPAARRATASTARARWSGCPSRPRSPRRRGASPRFRPHPSPLPPAGKGAQETDHDRRPIRQLPPRPRSSSRSSSRSPSGCSTGSTCAARRSARSCAPGSAARRSSSTAARSCCRSSTTSSRST